MGEASMAALTFLSGVLQFQQELQQPEDIKNGNKTNAIIVVVLLNLNKDLYDLYFYIIIYIVGKQFSTRK